MTGMEAIRGIVHSTLTLKILTKGLKVLRLKREFESDGRIPKLGFSI